MKVMVTRSLALLPLLLLSVACAGAASSGAPTQTGGGSNETGGSGTPASGGSETSVGGRNETGGEGGSAAGGGPGGLINNNDCPGTSPIEEAPPLCRTVSDCPNGYYYCSSNPSPGVIGCGPPPGYCIKDDDCAARATDGQKWVCGVSWPGYCSYMLACTPACSEGSCGEGAICGEDGHCQVISCEDGNECPSPKVCAPDREVADKARPRAAHSTASSARMVSCATRAPEPTQTAARR
jgi:hypothetical protein